MERIQISEKKFNKLTSEELNAGFALVTHDGSDQYVTDWKSILADCLQEAISTTKSKPKAAKWLNEQTNIQLLDKYYELNSDIDGNNHELLLAQITKGIPKLTIIQID